MKQYINKLTDKFSYRQLHKRLVQLSSLEFWSFFKIFEPKKSFRKSSPWSILPYCSFSAAWAWVLFAHLSFRNLMLWLESWLIRVLSTRKPFESQPFQEKLKRQLLSLIRWAKRTAFLCNYRLNSPFLITLDDFSLFIRSNRKIQSIISGTRTKLITKWKWMLFTANQIANKLRSLLKHQKAKKLNQISCFSNQSQPNQKFSHYKWSLK